MCIIIVKQAGAKLPKKNILETAAKLNPHGFGFATNGQMFKTLDFNEFYNVLTQTATTENALIMHFRLATHGSIKQSNCHPFFDADTGIYFAHNGVLSYPSVNDQTDSEYCFRNVIVPGAKLFGFYSKDFERLCDIEAGASRFALMHEDSIILSGFWYEKNGCYYSNDRVFNAIKGQRMYNRLLHKD